MKKNKIAMALLLLTILLVSVHYLNKKSGYFVDEGMTLFLANGNYNGAVTSQSDRGFEDFLEEYVLQDSIWGTLTHVVGMLKELTSAGNYSIAGTVGWYDAARSLLQGQRTWVNGEDLFHQLVVADGERFQYLQVYLNQAMDVHPPLYYLAVHTVFSLFPGTYSDAYLFIINIIALLMTCVVLFKTGELFTDNSRLSLLAIAIFGLSQGFLSCAIYFRMYAVFMLFATITVYLHLLIRRKKYQISKKLSKALVIAVVLGFYTHYYYVIFLVPIFIIYLIRMFQNKKRQEAWRYVKCMILAAVISLVIWPLSLYHILFGYRGTEAVSNLLVDGLMTKLKIYLEIISQAFTYGEPRILAIIIIAGIVLVVLKIVKGSIKDVFNSAIVEIMFACGFYLIIISQIAPVLSDRYIMCVYPMLALTIAMIITKTVDRFLRSAIMKNIVYVGMGTVLFVGSIWLITPNYLYLENQNRHWGVDKLLSELNCMMIAEDDWRGFPEELHLSQFNQVIVVGTDELGVLESQQPENTELDLLVYVLNELDQEDMLNMVDKYLNYEQNSESEIDSDIEGFRAYLFAGRNKILPLDEKRIYLKNK